MIIALINFRTFQFSSVQRIYSSLKLQILSAMKSAKKAKWFCSLRLHGLYRLISGSSVHPSIATPVGFLPVYAGEERLRFFIPTHFLSHPLFRMLLERAYREYGFEQSSGLMFPCNASVFQEVLSVVECTQGQFNIENWVEELM